MVPTARGALLALSAGHLCKALLVSKTPPPQEAGPWVDEAPDAMKKIYIAYDPASAEQFQHDVNSYVYTDTAEWVAGEFGECCGGIKTRTVVCKNTLTNDEVDRSDCYMKIKPNLAETCDCAEVACCASGATPPVGLTAADFQKPDCASYDFVDLGPCFAWTSGPDEPAYSPELGEWPLKCQGWGHLGAPCNAGLPYGHFPGMDAAQCMAKCTSIGMDAFGIEYGTICRCGPLPVNLEVWGDVPVRPELTMRANRLKITTTSKSKDGVCPLKVYRYAGPYEHNGVPECLRQGETVETVAEMDRIESNVVKLVPSEEDGSVMQYGATPLPGVTPWERKCWPGTCSAGEPWDKRMAVGTITFDLPHTTYAEYTIVPYVLDPEWIDDAREEVLKEAMRQIELETCIVFKEELLGTLSPDQKLLVTVGTTHVDQSTCHTKGYGKPPPEVGNAFFNMGSCSTNVHIGMVLHTLMEVLGMAPTQKRPDAILDYSGYGPYIWGVDYWMMNAESRFNNQPDWFAPSTTMYMGSNGVHVPFDYESIMLTSNKHDFLFQVPPQYKHVGQRSVLSAGDIAMINDVYSCVPGTKKTTNLYKMDSALDEEIRASSAEHFAKNLKDLEKAEKYAPEVAKSAKAILAEIKK